MAITIPELNSVSVVDDTDNIMLTHSNGNSEKISGSAFKADMIKNKIENNNGHAVSVNAVSTIMATSTTITGPELGAGGNIKILFTSAIAGVDTSTGLTLTYNGSPIAVKVGKDGALVDFCAYEVSTGVYRYLQAYTVLIMVYDGTQFIIEGKPVVISDTDYVVYADGDKILKYKQIDNMPTENSNNPAKSGGIFSLLGQRTVQQATSTSFKATWVIGNLLITEMRITQTIETASASGGIYWGVGTSIQFPREYAEKPTTFMFITQTTNADGNCFIWGRNPPTKTETGDFYVGRGTSRSNEVVIHVLAIGLKP